MFDIHEESKSPNEGACVFMLYDELESPNEGYVEDISICKVICIFICTHYSHDEPDSPNEGARSRNAI